MTDHAKALRYIAALVDSPPLAAQICYAAADEIDRLRAEVTRLRKVIADALELIETISPIEGETVRKIRAELECMQ